MTPHEEFSANNGTTITVTPSMVAPALSKSFMPDIQYGNRRQKTSRIAHPAFAF